MKYKTTKKDFAEFKHECLKWIEYFGLIDWEVIIEHSSEVEDTRGSCHWHETGRTATIVLERTWKHLPEKNEIKKVAFHEVCELMLARARNMSAIYCSQSIIDEVMHEVIRRLENSVFLEA